MSSEREALDHFGGFVTTHLRDAARNECERLLRGEIRAPGLQALQAALAAFAPEQRDVARRLVDACLTAAIHEFLLTLQEQEEFEGRIRVTVDGRDVAAASDGLHGEIFSPDGWFARFSAYGEPPEAAWTGIASRAHLPISLADTDRS